MKVMITLKALKDEYKGVAFEVTTQGAGYIEVNVPGLGIVKLYEGEYTLAEA